MKFAVSCIAVLLFASVSFAGSFAGTEDPKLTNLVKTVQELAKQEGAEVEGYSCIVIHSSKKALCNVYIKGETSPIRTTVKYERL